MPMHSVTLRYPDTASPASPNIASLSLYSREISLVVYIVHGEVAELVAGTVGYRIQKVQDEEDA